MSGTLDYGKGPSLANPLTSALDANGQRIENLPYPAADADAARRGDRFGLKPVWVARVETALPANTYSGAGGGGLGTLTANASGAFPAIDGQTLTVGQSLLLATQATASENGIYTLTDAGSGGTPWVLTRRYDCAHGAAIPTGLQVTIEAGTVGFQLLAFVAASGTIGTDAFTCTLPTVRSPLVSDLDGGGKKITNALFTGTLGVTTGYVQYDGGTAVNGSTKGTNFSTDEKTSRYYLSADSLTITLDDAVMAGGQTIEFISTTGTLSPGHTFTASSGTVTYAGAGGSPGASASWPSGAGSVVIVKVASGVFWRS